ncbi:helix-turn-helix domain-containing protein [Delftia sp. PS-11]|uniref:AraC family transcriptional regulator n=1 Tax=Delftia sp. PS-11 TaxID=2767222 RepID=UPI002459CE1A|nr:helix-turn-helix transcriptional regulator [Delftia sp. PS-11]
MAVTDMAQLDDRRWRSAERAFQDEPLEAVPPEQVQCSSQGLPWHGISVWHQRTDAQDLYIPPAGKHCVIVRRGPTTGLIQKHGGEMHSSRWKTGEALLLPAHTPSFWRTELPRDNLHLDISPQWLQKVSGQENSTIALRSSFGRHDPLLFQLVQVLLQALDNNSALNPAFADGIATSVAIHLLEHYRAPSNGTVNTALLSAKQLKRVQSLVLENMEQPLSIAVLAAEARLSAYHFARSFKATCGLTPHQFVLQQRMKRARKLLLESSDSIAEIAMRVGFGSAPHFSQTFGKYWGITPSKLRQQH